ncbi:MAG: AI-2E family transporter [Patescibacteria group bacterium]
MAGMLKNQPVNISLASIVKVAFVVLGLWFLYLVKEIVALLFLAIIIASAIAPLADLFERKRIPRMGTVIVVYLLCVAAFVLVLYLIIPPIVDELKQLAGLIPEYYETVTKQIFKTTRGISPDAAKNAQEFLITFGEKIRSVTSGFLSVVAGAFGGVVAFGAVLVTSFYLAIQRRGVEDFLRLVTPKANEAYVVDLWTRVEHKLGRWLQGQLLLALIVGVTVFIGLSFIGVPYALLLGVAAALFEIVPIVGPLLSAVLGISLAIIISPFLALLTLVFYVILQQVENHILVPLLMKRVTGLNPVVVIVALLAGAHLGGVLGMIIAVPLATIAGELLDDFAKHKATDKSTERAHAA